MTTERHDYLFFVYDGTYSGMRVVRNVAEEQLDAVIRELEEADFMLNGAIQLAREQTHYKDTAIIQPKKFIVWTADDNVKWLHDVEEFKRPSSAIEELEQDANKSLEDQLDEERAAGEGMFPDEVDDPSPQGGANGMGQD